MQCRSKDEIRRHRDKPHGLSHASTEADRAHVKSRTSHDKNSLSVTASSCGLYRIKRHHFCFPTTSTSPTTIEMSGSEPVSSHLLTQGEKNAKRPRGTFSASDNTSRCKRPRTSSSDLERLHADLRQAKTKLAAFLAGETDGDLTLESSDKVVESDRTLELNEVKNTFLKFLMSGDPRRSPGSATNTGANELKGKEKSCYISESDIDARSSTPESLGSCDFFCPTNENCNENVGDREQDDDSRPLNVLQCRLAFPQNSVV